MVLFNRMVAAARTCSSISQRSNAPASAPLMTVRKSNTNSLPTRAKSRLKTSRSSNLVNYEAALVGGLFHVCPAWASTWRWESSRERVIASEANRRASFREAGVITPASRNDALRFASLAMTSSREDSHLQVDAHAGHT